MDLDIPLPKHLGLSAGRWGGTTATFIVTLASGMSLSIDVNKVDQRPYKKHTFICNSEACPDLHGNQVVVDWDANAFPSVIKCGEDLLGYIDGTIFDPNRISLGYARKTDTLGNRWDILSTHGSLHMQKERQRKRWSWKEKRHDYDFISDEMKSCTIDIRLIIGLVVEFWTPRLLMYSDPGPTG